MFFRAENNEAFYLTDLDRTERFTREIGIGLIGGRTATEAAADAIRSVALACKQQ